MRYIFQIANIREVILDLVAKTITSLLTYISYHCNCLLTVKDALYLAKTVVDLLITCNISKMTQKAIKEISYTKCFID